MEREELKEKAKEQIDEVADKLETLEAKKDQVKAETKDKYNRLLSDLKENKEELINKAEKLEQQSDDKWEETKEAFESASKSFEKGFTEISSLV